MKYKVTCYGPGCKKKVVLRTIADYWCSWECYEKHCPEQAKNIIRFSELLSRRIKS